MHKGPLLSWAVLLPLMPCPVWGLGGSCGLRRGLSCARSTANTCSEGSGCPDEFTWSIPAKSKQEGEVRAWRGQVISLSHPSQAW